MKLRSHLTVLGLAVALIAAGASPALAAKGVKKNKKGTTTEHQHHGVVVHVDHKKGLLEIRSHHKGSKKKNGKVAKGATHLHRYTVTASTKVFSQHGKKRTPSNFSHVRKGEHVSVASHNGHADIIVIHHRTKGKKAVSTNTGVKNKGNKNKVVKKIAKK
jgi:hypothetical protein